MWKNQKLVLNFLFLFSILFILSFQNCSQVNFESELQVENLGSNNCPPNFVEIPSNPQIKSEAFCTSVTEMSGSGMVAESKVELPPRVNVSRQDAILLCERMGLNYTLMREKDRLAIVEWIRSNHLNYASNQVNYDRPDLLNAGNFLSEKFLQIEPKLNQQVQWTKNRRTHFIVREDVIWDFSGNLSEWIRDENKTYGGHYENSDASILKTEVTSNSDADPRIGFRCVYLTKPDQVTQWSTPTPNPSSTPTLTPSPTPNPTSTPTPVPTVRPVTPTPVPPTPAPTVQPTVTPRPSITPIVTPTPIPPTPVPTVIPTVTPFPPTPTPFPTATPIVTPTVTPYPPTPTPMPTVAPTPVPTYCWSRNPAWDNSFEVPGKCSLNGACSNPGTSTTTKCLDTNGNMTSTQVACYSTALNECVGSPRTNIQPTPTPIQPTPTPIRVTECTYSNNSMYLQISNSEQVDVTDETEFYLWNGTEIYYNRIYINEKANIAIDDERGNLVSGGYQYYFGQFRGGANPNLSYEICRRRL